MEANPYRQLNCAVPDKHSCAEKKKKVVPLTNEAAAQVTSRSYRRWEFRVTETILAEVIPASKEGWLLKQR